MDCRNCCLIHQCASQFSYQSLQRNTCLTTHCPLQSSAKGFVSVMLEKYKDPKTSINTAVTSSLRQIHSYCLTLTDLGEDFGAALAHKNPKIKEATAKLLQVCHFLLLCHM